MTFMPRVTFRHAFVDTLPDTLEEGILYVSVRYATAAHNCFCGCGHEVVTPLHPAKWQLYFDGKSISLFPSIGSWALPCQSHYWLRNSQVAWGAKWSREQITEVRARDQALEEAYLGVSARADKPTVPSAKNRNGRLRRFWRALTG